MTATVVLGSNSFSGQDFINLLLTETDRNVIGISRSAELPAHRLRYKSLKFLDRFRFQQFDMNDEMEALLAFLDSEKPREIINFAAQSEVGPSWLTPEHWYQTNTVALAKMVNHLRRSVYLERYVHISSPEAYGDCSQTHVVEGTPDNPSTPYAASKSAADALLRVYFKEYGFPVTWIRATNVYGAYQQLFKVIPRTFIYMRNGMKLQLDGGGKAIKSFIEVRDVSRGEYLAMTKGNVGETYHLSPDDGVSVRSLVTQIAATRGKSLADVAEDGPERPGQDAAYVIDSSKARRKLRWKPEISLDVGLQETADWVDAHWNEISAASLSYDHKA